MPRPETLIALDQAESDLDFLELELKEAHPNLDLVLIVGDIVDCPAMERVFEEHRPVGVKIVVA